MCQICETNEHATNDYPTLPSFKECLHEQAHALNSLTGTYEAPGKTQPHTSNEGMYNLREDHDL